jgi:hypothetical protein
MKSSSRVSFAAAAPFPFSQSIPEALRRSGEHRRAVVGRRLTVEGWLACIEHGSVRSSACPGEVFGVAPARSATGPIRNAAPVRRSRSAKLRRCRSGGILFCGFGERSSSSHRVARGARQSQCQGAGAASMTATQASLTSRSSARRVSTARCRTASRAGAQRGRYATQSTGLVFSDDDR